MIVCAGKSESFYFAKSIGVGLIESAIGLTKICMRECVDSIIFIGSAGAYNKSIDIGSLYLSDDATQVEVAFLETKAYTPLDNHIRSGVLTSDYLVSCETLNSGLFQKTIVNSSNYITTDDTIAKQFTNAGIFLENMEFFAVMRVAQHFEIPCVGVFCISNHCHTNAHNEFMANKQIVADTLNKNLSLIQYLSSTISNKINLKSMQESV